MKNLKFFLILFIFSTISYSCEPDELISDNQYLEINDVYGSNGDQKNVIDTGEEDDDNEEASSGDQKNVLDTGEDE